MNATVLSTSDSDVPPRGASRWNDGKPSRRSRGRFWAGVALGVPLTLAFTHSVLARTDLATPYSVSVPVRLENAEQWANADAASFEAARAANADLPDPNSLQTMGEAAPSSGPVNLASMQALTGPPPPRFVFRGATPVDTARAHYCLTSALYYEAASESDDGMRAVAQVVLNRVRHPSFPNTVCGVVFQGSQRPLVCQFTFSCDGSMARRPAVAVWARASRIASEALAGRTFPGVGMATHYHTLAVWPSWGRSLVMTNVVGAHIFHRWRGRWSLPASFTNVYTGREPLPGPYLPIAQQLAARAGRSVTADTALATAATPVTTATPGAPDSAALAAIEAANRGGGGAGVLSTPATAATAPAAQARTAQTLAAPPPSYADPRLGQSGTVRDEYQNSGTPIR